MGRGELDGGWFCGRDEGMGALDGRERGYRREERGLPGRDGGATRWRQRGICGDRFELNERGGRLVDEDGGVGEVKIFHGLDEGHRLDDGG